MPAVKVNQVMVSADGVAAAAAVAVGVVTVKARRWMAAIRFTPQLTTVLLHQAPYLRSSKPD